MNKRTFIRTITLSGLALSAAGKVANTVPNPPPDPPAGGGPAAEERAIADLKDAGLRGMGGAGGCGCAGGSASNLLRLPIGIV